MLGRVDPYYFLGGGISIDRAAATIDGRSGRKLGLGKTNAPEGTLDVIDRKMAQAIRKLTVEKGIEPRDFAIVAFGSRGRCTPVSRPRARNPRSLVPTSPGAFSAWGMLQTEIRHDLCAESVLRQPPEGARHLDELDNSYVLLETEARDLLHAEGIKVRDIRMERLIDLRYIGQVGHLESRSRYSPDEIPRWHVR